MKDKNDNFGRLRTNYQKLEGQSSFARWFNTKLLPFTSRINNERHFAALRDVFGLLIPIIIIGGMGTLVTSIIFGGSGSGYVSLMGLFCKAAHPGLPWNSSTGEISINSVIQGTGIVGAFDAAGNHWNTAMKITSAALGTLSSVSIGSLSIYVSFIMGYLLGRIKNFSSPISVGIASFFGFELLNMGQMAYFADAKGLIIALISSVCVSELFMKLSSIHALRLRIYGKIPESVRTSFSLFLPLVITMLVLVLLNLCFLIPAVIGSKLAVTSNFQFTMALDKSDQAFSNLMVDSDGVLVDHGEVIGKFIQFMMNYNQEWFSDPSKRYDIIKEFYGTLNSVEQGQFTCLISHYFAGASGFHDVSSTANHLIFIESSKMISGTYVTTDIEGVSYGFSAALYQFFVSWFIRVTSGDIHASLIIAIFYVFFVGFLWFFGIHGTNILLGIFQPLFLITLSSNADLVLKLGYDAAAATGEMGVFTTSFFDSFVWIGGSGASLCFSIAILTLSKRRELISISRFLVPLGVCQINEPVVFGVPIILNMTYFIPFIFAPILNVIMAWILSPAVSGFVHYSYVQTPWAAPWFLASLITTLDPRALVPALVSLVLGVGIYIPFVIIDNIFYARNLKAESEVKYDEFVRYFGSKRDRYNINTEQKVNVLMWRADDYIKEANEKVANLEETYGAGSHKVKELKGRILFKAHQRYDELTYQARIVKSERDLAMSEKEIKWGIKAEKLRVKKLEIELKRKNKEAIKARKAEE